MTKKIYYSKSDIENLIKKKESISW